MNVSVWGQTSDLISTEIEFFELYFLLPVLSSYPVLSAPRGEGGPSAYERGGDARRLAQGWKFRILVSLRVF